MKRLYRAKKLGKWPSTEPKVRGSNPLGRAFENPWGRLRSSSSGSGGTTGRTRSRGARGGVRMPSPPGSRQVRDGLLRAGPGGLVVGDEGDVEAWRRGLRDRSRGARQGPHAARHARGVRGSLPARAALARWSLFEQVRDRQVGSWDCGGVGSRGGPTPRRGMPRRTCSVVLVVSPRRLRIDPRDAPEPEHSRTGWPVCLRLVSVGVALWCGFGAVFCWYLTDGYCCGYAVFRGAPWRGHGNRFRFGSVSWVDVKRLSGECWGEGRIE